MACIQYPTLEAILIQCYSWWLENQWAGHAHIVTQRQWDYDLWYLRSVALKSIRQRRPPMLPHFNLT